MGLRLEVGPGSPNRFPPAAIQEQLHRILASDVFSNSRRLSNFLQFIVENACSDDGPPPKEYLIGTEVFGRGQSYDPRTDPIVRVEAGRLRSKLAEYYRTQGQNDPVVINLPKGMYVPTFQWHEPAPPVAVVAPAAAASTHMPYWGVGARGGMVIAGLVLVLTGWTVGRLYPRRAVPSSIAVLPFLNLSPAPEYEYLSDGLSEELTTSLAGLKGLRVVARTSAFQFRGKAEDVRRIGERLNVGAVLEGGVRREGDHLRVTAQLISTQDGYHLWSGAYDAQASDLFTIKEKIIQETARALRLPSPPGQQRTLMSRRTENPDAYDLYLRGRYFWSKRNLPDMERSIELFEGATKKDPNFALAYAGLAETLVVMGGNGQKPLSEVVPRAKQALARALELDPTMGEAQASLALLNSESSGKRRQLEPELRRAVELSPGYANAHHWLGLILSAQGRFEEADAELRRAETFDPLAPMIREGLAENFYAWRRYDDAIGQVRRMHEMGSDIGDYVLGRAYIQKGMCREAIDVFNRLRQGENPPMAQANLAIAYAAAGQDEEARKMLSKVTALRRGYVPPYWIALVHLRLGEKDEAFRWLQAAYQQNDPSLGQLKVDPLLDPLRSDPRYGELLRKADLND